MTSEMIPEKTAQIDSNESSWTRGLTAMMLAAIAMSTVVLGVVAIVAMSKSDSGSTVASDLPTTVSVELSEFQIAMSTSTVRPRRSMGRRRISWICTGPAWARMR